MSEKTQDQLDNEASAKKDLEYIDQLTHSEAFQQYFMRRLTAKIKEQAIIMDDASSSDAQTLEAKKVKKILESIAKMPQEDAIGCRSILGISD